MKKYARIKHGVRSSYISKTKSGRGYCQYALCPSKLKLFHKKDMITVSDSFFVCSFECKEKLLLINRDVLNKIEEMMSEDHRDNRLLFEI